MLDVALMLAAATALGLGYLVHRWIVLAADVRSGFAWSSSTVGYPRLGPPLGRPEGVVRGWSAVCYGASTTGLGVGPTEEGSPEAVKLAYRAWSALRWALVP